MPSQVFCRYVDYLDNFFFEKSHLQTICRPFNLVKKLLGNSPAQSALALQSGMGEVSVFFVQVAQISQWTTFWISMDCRYMDVAAYPQNKVLVGGIPRNVPGCW